MLILWLLLDCPCAKAVLHEAFDYAPYNEAPVLAQPSPEGGVNAEENATLEPHGVVSESDADIMTGTYEEARQPRLNRKDIFPV